MVIKFIPQKRAIHVGTTGCPGISGTGRLSLWSTGGPLHDLLTSQAASGKDSGGIEKLLCRFESLWGYRWELWSGLSKAEFPLRLSKVLVAFINRSAVSPEAKSRDTQSKGSHEDMTKSYWPLIWAKLLWDQICTCCLGQRTYGGFGLHILTGQPQCTLKHGQLKNISPGNICLHVEMIAPFEYTFISLMRSPNWVTFASCSMNFYLPLEEKSFDTQKTQTSTYLLCL